MTDRHELLAASVARRIPDLHDAVIQCHQFGINSAVISAALTPRHGDAASRIAVMRMIHTHEDARREQLVRMSEEQAARFQERIKTIISRLRGDYVGVVREVPNPHYWAAGSPERQVFRENWSYGSTEHEIVGKEWRYASTDPAAG